jgi:DNA-binding beta-propeller fold protein YncE
MTPAWLWPWSLRVTCRSPWRRRLRRCASAWGHERRRAPHRLAFIACDGNARLLVFDLASLRVTSVQTVGDNPDVLAFDSSMQRLYVAAESGIVAVFDERGRSLHKVAEGFVTTEAHVIAVDPRTHRLYLPLEDVDGKPVLRVAAWAGRR